MRHAVTRNVAWWMLAVLALGCGKAESKKAEADAATAETAAGATEAVTADAPAEPALPADGVALAIVDYPGIMEKIAANRGKVVVMDAWSTSCPPCMKEFHNLVELHKKYGPEKVACISLSFDFEGIGTPEEQQERVLKFLRSQGATFTNLLGSEESDALYRKFQLAAVPAVFVYDPAGNLAKRFDNEQAKSAADAFTYEQVGQLVGELLEGKAASATPAAEATK